MHRKLQWRIGVILTDQLVAQSGAIRPQVMHGKTCVTAAEIQRSTQAMKRLGVVKLAG